METVRSHDLFEDVRYELFEDIRPELSELPGHIKAGMERLDLRFAPGGTLVMSLNADKVELRKKRLDFFTGAGPEEAHLEKVAIEYYEPDFESLAERSLDSDSGKLSETLGSLGSCLPVGEAVAGVNMHDVSLSIFLRNGEGAFITSRSAQIDEKTGTLRLMGEVEAVSPHFTLAEEELRFDTRNMSFILPSGHIFSLRDGNQIVSADSLAFFSAATLQDL
jgi:hypothetical protein